MSNILPEYQDYDKTVFLQFSGDIYSNVSVEKTTYALNCWFLNSLKFYVASLQATKTFQLKH